MQVYSRVFVVWAIVELTPGVADNIGLLIVCYAWGITEVIRYSYYFFALIDAVPYIIKWCRYILSTLSIRPLDKFDGWVIMLIGEWPCYDVFGRRMVFPRFEIGIL